MATSIDIVPGTWNAAVGTSEFCMLEGFKQTSSVSHVQKTSPSVNGHLVAGGSNKLPLVCPASQAMPAPVEKRTSNPSTKVIQPKLIAVPLKAFAGSLAFTSLGVPGSQTAGRIIANGRSGQPVLSLILNSAMNGSGVHVGNKQSVPIFLASTSFSSGTVLQPVKLSSVKTVSQSNGPEIIKKARVLKAEKKCLKVGQNQIESVPKQEVDGEVTFLKEVPKVKSRKWSKSASSVQMPLRPSTAPASAASISEIILSQSTMEKRKSQISVLRINNPGCHNSAPVLSPKKRVVKDPQKSSPILPPGIKLERIETVNHVSDLKEKDLCNETNVNKKNGKGLTNPGVPLNNGSLLNPHSSEIASLTLKAFENGSIFDCDRSNKIGSVSVEHLPCRTEEQPSSFAPASCHVRIGGTSEIDHGADVVDSPRCPSSLVFARKSQPGNLGTAKRQRNINRQSRRERIQVKEEWKDSSFHIYQKLVHEVSPLARILERRKSCRAANQRILPPGPLNSSDSEDDGQFACLQQRLDLAHNTRQSRSSRRRGNRIAKELISCKKETLSCLRKFDYVGGLDLIAALRQESVETTKILLGHKEVGKPLISNRAKLRLYSKRRCQFVSDDDIPACDAIALPCSNLCRNHIFQSSSQTLFESCVGVDNIPCGVPAIPGLCEVPLCSDHFASVGKSLQRRVPRQKSRKRGRPSMVQADRDGRASQRSRKLKSPVTSVSLRKTANNNRIIQSKPGWAESDARSERLPRTEVRHESVSEEAMEVDSLGNLSDQVDYDDDLTDAFPTEAFRGIFENGGIGGESFEEALEELAGYNVSSDMFDILSDSAFADAMLSRGIETLVDDDLEGPNFVWDSAAEPEILKGYSEQFLRVHSPVPAASPPGICSLISETTRS